MKKKVFSIIFISLTGLFFYSSNAQISRGGRPYTFTNGSDVLPAIAVPVYVLPTIDMNALKAEDALTDKLKNIPWRFGLNVDVSISRETDGIEEILPDGSKLWRMSVASQGALTLNFLFEQFKIPPGAELFFYNADKTELHGAFTDFNNQEDLFFATTLIRGDFITIEYFEPFDAAFRGDLHLSRVTHGYRGADEFLKGFGQSGACNVNVACPQSAGMEDQIRSVCMLVTGSNGFCTGALINNTANDGKPYVLSADHCFTNPGSVIFWFNWQSPTCPNPPTSPPYNSMSGAVTKARFSATDLWLMEINQPIPEAFNVFYSGWNRTTDNNIAGKIWGIHHPTGDIKKISWSTLGVTTTTYVQNNVPGDGTHWRIAQWSDGTTTEGGSSGSPLYDPFGRIIGQLHGGFASCASMTSDWYGKLGVSWTGGGSDATRLSTWLDPVNSGAELLEGYDPVGPSVALDVQMLAILSPLSIYCSQSTVQPEVIIKNRGTQTLTSATVNYVLNSGSPVVINWTGSLTTNQTETITFPLLTLTPGLNQTFVATVSDPNNQNDENPANNQAQVSLNVYDDFLPPFSENFDGITFRPACWTEEFVTGSTGWVKANGGQSGNPPTAYSGNGNAMLYYPNFSAATTKLITPPLKIDWLTNPVLTFRHAQAPWSGDQDELRVYYRTSSTAQWTLLETYTSATTTWTERTISLPEVTHTYYVAFEGKAKWGYGVCIDDVLITSGNIGIDETVDPGFTLFPNPSDGIFTVQFTKLPGRNAFLTVSDINGKIVHTSHIDGNTEKLVLDLAHLDSGLYLLKYRSENLSIVKKIVLQK
jgi:hypothetical protein